ncbi:MAG: RluA family pseudouridine synthase, partial [Saprospiraceae bacterium]|nr:RluA family pseudouridine synthase [Saprospiraceae bacterium]
MKFKSPEILFEDEYMIAVNKPAGILTIPDRFNADIPNLVKGLKQKYPDLIPVHRLDKFTSGVILFAKDAETHKLLSASFESREIEKYYIAIVDGVPSPESG